MKISDFMKSKKSVKIGYIGGSITEQSGWRDVVTAHLRESFSDNDITEVNAGIGGTNSFLGVARIERDLICHNPDIVFIEFSVNDGAETYDECRFFGRTYEGMIRQLLNNNPDVLIVGVGLTTEGMNEKFYKNGIIPYTAQHHKIVCDYYNVPFSNAGESLYNHMKKIGGKMLDFTRDNVHTNDKGAEFYGDFIWDCIKEYDFDINFKNEPLHSDNCEAVTLCTVDPVPQGWTNGVWRRDGKEEKHIYSCVPGSEFEFKFKGNVLGIYCTTEKTSGNICWSVDGGEWKERSTWDEYAMNFDRRHYYTLEENLGAGEHTVTVKVSDKKEELSEGYYLRIIAFMTGRI